MLDFIDLDLSANDPVNDFPGNFGICNEFDFRFSIPGGVLYNRHERNHSVHRGMALSITQSLHP